MARDVRDLAVAMDVLSGPDGGDPRPSPPPRDFTAVLDEGVAGMRVLWSPDFGHIGVDPAVAARAGATAARLAEAGAVVETPELKLDASWPWFTTLLRGEVAYGGAAPSFTNDPAFVARCREPENLARLAEYNQMAMQAPPVEREDFDAAEAWLAGLRRTFETLFERYDAILSPTLPVVAPILPEGLADPYPTFCCGTFYTAIANLLRLPALSFPAAWSTGCRSACR
jgi:aspartyl-tRNA(Asn)/glutamyl-tRNA(Gln) amidotransferase subunit A